MVNTLDSRYITVEYNTMLNIIQKVERLHFVQIMNSENKANLRDLKAATGL